MPTWTIGEEIVFTARTGAELSIISRQETVPEGIRSEGGWRCLRVEGHFAFDEVGVLLSLLEPLADSGIGVLAVSTFDTDYLFVKDFDLGRAVGALREDGHTVIFPS